MPALCPTPEELKAFSLGNLPSLALERVADHVDHCAVCDAVLKALDEHSDGLVTELRGLELKSATAAPVPPELLNLARQAADQTSPTSVSEIAVDPGRRFA